MKNSSLNRYCVSSPKILCSLAFATIPILCNGQLADYHITEVGETLTTDIPGAQVSPRIVGSPDLPESWGIDFADGSFHDITGGIVAPEPAGEPGYNRVEPFQCCKGAPFSLLVFSDVPGTAPAQSDLSIDGHRVVFEDKPVADTTASTGLLTGISMLALIGASRRLAS